MQKTRAQTAPQPRNAGGRYDPVLEIAARPGRGQSLGILGDVIGPNAYGIPQNDMLVNGKWVPAGDPATGFTTYMDGKTLMVWDVPSQTWYAQGTLIDEPFVDTPYFAPHSRPPVDLSYLTDISRVVDLIDPATFDSSPAGFDSGGTADLATTDTQPATYIPQSGVEQVAITAEAPAAIATVDLTVQQPTTTAAATGGDDPAAQTEATVTITAADLMAMPYGTTFVAPNGHSITKNNMQALGFGANYPVTGYWDNTAGGWIYDASAFGVFGVPVEYPPQPGQNETVPITADAPAAITTADLTIQQPTVPQTAATVAESAAAQTDATVQASTISAADLMAMPDNTTFIAPNGHSITKHNMQAYGFGANYPVTGYWDNTAGGWIYDASEFGVYGVPIIYPPQPGQNESVAISADTPAITTADLTIQQPATPATYIPPGGPEQVTITATQPATEQTPPVTTTAAVFEVIPTYVPPGGPEQVTVTAALPQPDLSTDLSVMQPPTPAVNTIPTYIPPGGPEQVTITAHPSPSPSLQPVDLSIPAITDVSLTGPLPDSFTGHSGGGHGHTGGGGHNKEGQARAPGSPLPKPPTPKPPTPKPPTHSAAGRGSPHTHGVELQRQGTGVLLEIPWWWLLVAAGVIAAASRHER